MLFTGIEKFEEASHAFQLVVDLPVNEIHEIQIEAAKKLTLMKILIGGASYNTDQLKEGTNFSQSPYSNIYMMVNRPYIKDKHLSFDSWIAKNLDEFTESGNMGLCKQIMNKHKYGFLEEFSKSYIMLLMKDVQKRIQEQEE